MQIVPKAIRSKHDVFLRNLRIAKLIVISIINIWNWLLFIWITIIFQDIILSAKNLIGNIKFSLLLLGYKIFTSLPEYSKDRVSNVIAPYYAVVWM